MGLIKALTGAGGSTLADQWKEFFYCEALPKEVLVTKGEKRIGNRIGADGGPAAEQQADIQHTERVRGDAGADRRV